MANLTHSDRVLTAVNGARLELGALLRDAFGARFDFWACVDPTAGPGPSDAGRPCASGDRASDDGIVSTPGSPPALAYKLVGRGAAPRVEPLSDGRWQLALRLPDIEYGWVIASAEVPCSDPQWILRVARQVRSRLDGDRRLADMQYECDVLVEQVSGDLEELTFLQSAVAQSAVPPKVTDASPLIERLLPELGQRVAATWIAFSPVDQDEGLCEAGAERATLRTIHVNSPADYVEHLETIIKTYGDSARCKTLVLNRGPDSQRGLAVDRQRNLILEPVAHRDHLYGWIVVVDRQQAMSNARRRGERPANGVNGDEFGTNEAMLVKSTASILAAHIRNIRLFEEKKQLLIGTVRALVNALDAKDPYTAGHSERVAMVARRLGQLSGYGPSAQERIYFAGLLHDVGKIAIRDEVLNNEQRLNDRQYREIKRHPEKGWAILYGLKDLDEILLGVLHHHERWDGSGYPDGLAGDCIPNDGRILAVADTFDAMTSDRSYRKALPEEKVISVLQEGANRQWDPRVVRLALDHLAELNRIRDEHVTRKTAVRRPAARAGAPAAPSSLEMEGLGDHSAAGEFPEVNS